MAAEHETLNEISAEKAVEIVRKSNPNQDREAVANGGRVTSEVIHRTLAKLGLDLPEGYEEALSAEFDAAEASEEIGAYRTLQLRREMEASGP